MTNLQKLNKMRGEGAVSNAKKLAAIRESAVKMNVKNMLEQSIKAKKYNRTLLESTGCVYSGAFPEWALPYAKDRTNREDVSENQAAMVDGWFRNMEQQGYDMSKIEYGRNVYEFENPEFGMPCECVDVSVPLRNELINERMMLDGYFEIDDNGNISEIGAGSSSGSDYEVTITTEGSGTPCTRRISAQSVDDLIDQAIRLFTGIGLRYDQVEDVSCMKVQDGSDQSEMFVKPFLDMLQQID